MKKISTFEYNTLIWFLIRACFTELTFTSILYYTRQDSWISITIGIILGLIPFSIYEFLKQKYPNENIITLNNKLWKKFGKVLNMFIFLGSLAIVTCTFWILVHFSSALFLYKTNLWIISLALIIPTSYAASKTINIISKVSLMLFYASLIFNVLILFGLIGNIDISNVKPIFESNVKDILKCSFMLVGINIMKLFYLNIINKNIIKNYSSKYSIIMYFITTINLLIIAFTTVCVFGIDLSTLYEYPAFQILKRVNILGIFDRIESILSIEALFSMFIQITIIIYYLKETILETFKLNKKTNKYIVISICLFIYIISNIIFITHESGEKFFINPLLYITYIILFIIPSITLIKSLNNIKIPKRQKNSASQEG